MRSVHSIPDGQALATPVFVVPNPDGATGGLGFDITSGLGILNGEEVGVFRAIINVEPFLFGVCNVILPIVVELFDGALPAFFGEGLDVAGTDALIDNTVWPTDLEATPEFLAFNKGGPDYKPADGFASARIHARYVGDVNVIGNVIPVNIVVFDRGVDGYAHVPIVGWPGPGVFDNLCTPYSADVLYFGETDSGDLLRQCRQQAVHTFEGRFILRDDGGPVVTRTDTGTCGTPGVTPTPTPTATPTPTPTPTPIVVPSGFKNYCITGTSTGVDWEWEVEVDSVSVKTGTAGPVLPFGASEILIAAAWVASMNGVSPLPPTATQLAPSFDHCFSITTPGVHTLIVDGCPVTPAGCSFNPTVFEVPPVGGTVELLAGGSDSPASAADGSGSSASVYAILAVAAAAVLAAGGWYARRRFLR
jgi:hypothetical protein